nr:hypothetical protein [uncultured Celeribacter sp.]
MIALLSHLAALPLAERKAELRVLAGLRGPEFARYVRNRLWARIWGLEAELRRSRAIHRRRALLRRRNRNVQRAQPSDMQRTDLLAELQAECPWPHEVAQ